jgi:hypothetical protein
MKIRKTQPGFVSVIIPGVNALFIELDEQGADITLSDLLATCSLYDYVVVKNLYKDSVKEFNTFIKKLFSASHKVKIQFDINGTFLPPNAGSFGRVVYNVFYDNDKIYDKKVIKWLRDASSNFIFTVKEIKDLDDVKSFATKNEIDTSKIYILLNEIEESIVDYVRLLNFNIAVDLSEVLGG